MSVESEVWRRIVKRIVKRVVKLEKEFEIGCRLPTGNQDGEMTARSLENMRIRFQKRSTIHSIFSMDIRRYSAVHW